MRPTRDARGRHRRPAVVVMLALLIGALPAAALAEPMITIQDGGDAANRVDVVFLGDGYTAAELGKYAADVQTLVDGFFAEQPYLEYRSYFNIRRIDVVSNQSGADHPELGTFVDTALDAAYNCSNIAWLICVNLTKVNTVLLNSLPSPASRDIVFVVVNDAAYGGSGGSVAVASTDPQMVELLLHETGHSFGLLADEYDTQPPPCDDTLEPQAPNATKATTRESIKWVAWIHPSTPIPTSGPTAGLPGLYQGAQYCPTTLFRPTFDSKMRSLGLPFEQINVEQHVKRIYNLVSAIDASSPPGPSLTLPAGGRRPSA